MKTIQIPALDQLSTASVKMLEQIQKKLGKIPNLYATIGYSSGALKSMIDTEAALSKDSSFSAKEREAVNLIVSQVNKCDYCLAAHTVLAKMRGYTQEETIAIRKADYGEAKLNSVLLLARSITQTHGKADESLSEEFYKNGYDEKALIELIALISLRSFTNYVYSNTKIPIDFPAAAEI